MVATHRCAGRRAEAASICGLVRTAQGGLIELRIPDQSLLHSSARALAKICRRNVKGSACLPQSAITVRGFPVWMIRCGEIALNPYKQVIFPHRRAIKSALVSCITDAMKGALNNKFRMKLSMKANLKIALSALALAALVAAPLVAKSYILPLFSAGSAAPDWKEYENPKYSFAIHFPVDPTLEATTFHTADGRSLEA